MPTRPDPASSAVVLIDVQERLLGAFAEPVRQRLMSRLGLLLAAARHLSLPVIVTEQYPQGLGRTVAELQGDIDPAWPTVAKTSFSCFGEPGFTSALAQSLRIEPAEGSATAPAMAPGISSRRGQTLILCGIETHVCVQQTALDALDAGFPRVVVASDAVAARHDSDHTAALSLLDREGAWISTAEAIVFMLLGDARHPAFKLLSARIRGLS